MNDAPRLPPGLSAPEAHLLVNLPHWSAQQALKTGFMGLVAQGILRLDIEERPGIFRTRRIPHLRVAANLPSPLPPVAASLVSVVRAAEPDGVLKTVLSKCQIEYGQTLSNFIKGCVGPALVARGLVVPVRKRALGIFPYNTFALTATGEQEQARLRSLIREARAVVPELLKSDPDAAASLVTALGSAFLLVEELKPHYPELEKAMRQSESDGSGGGSGGDGYYFPNSETSAVGDGGFCFDFGHLDFSCFDSGAFDSFDAGFSDGGGGDGGGGDGGGSGC